jgi:glutamate formiminotransferase
MDSPILLAVPNVSEGRDARTVARVGEAFAGVGDQRGTSVVGERARGASPSGVRLLDVHSDPDHHRSVFTLAGPQGDLAAALLRGAAVAVEQIDVVGRLEGELSEAGQHPHVGALDVVPIVYLEEAAKGAACAEALVVADRLGEELGVPVFLYGELSASARRPARTRAELRRGGIAGLRARMEGAEVLSPDHRSTTGGAPLRADFGPARLHPTAGATLVAARPPLVAFNLELAPPATLEDARRIAALIREGGAEGLPGLRAIGVALGGARAQVSMNLERPMDVPLASVVEAVARHAPLERAELVGLAPRAALEGFPVELPMPGFDPARHVIENAIGC